MRARQTEVGSVADLIHQTRQLSAVVGHRWLFRGQPDAEWTLQASIHRGDYAKSAEQKLTQEFRARAGVRHAHHPRYGDYADWLALMQHYGLPTRLLDWSHSPLTAAFFAVEQTLPHHDGPPVHARAAAIWAICPSLLNVSQGLEAYIYPLNSGDLRALVEGAFYVATGASKLRALKSPSVAAAMAVESDVRMQVQRGAFTIHGVGTPMEDLRGRETWLRKFVVPAACVSSLGAEVEALGVGLADLFPDLGSLAKSLKTQFKRV